MVHRNPVTSNGEVEGNDNPPVFDKRWDTIDQAPEKRQKGEFDSHDCYPSEYKALNDQFTKCEDSIQILRVECEASRRVHNSLDEI